MKKTLVAFGSVLIITLAASMTISKASQATQPSMKTLYYQGQIETKHLSSNHTFPLQEITLKKALDPKNNRIIEIACAPIGPSSPAQYAVSPIYMKVAGNTLTKIADTADYSSINIEGTGTVFGQSWSWENLTFDMKTAFGGQTSWVKDVNFVSGEFLYGTKYIFINEGTEENPKRKSEAELLMNLKMKVITVEDFEAANTELGCDNSGFLVEE